MFKVENQKDDSEFYSIRTTEDNDFKYAYNVITKRATSATDYHDIKEFTKTELMELFATLSVNDVWSVEYLTYDKNKEWSEDLAEKIQGMAKDDAATYIKKNFKEFGKNSRIMVGHKID